jgi:hypothetical protein
MQCAICRHGDLEDGSVTVVLKRGEATDAWLDSKNWKRGGAWVNVVTSSLRGRRWDQSAVPAIASPKTTLPPARQRWHKTTDTSPSGKEWGWVCGLLESGSPPEHVYYRCSSGLVCDAATTPLDTLAEPFNGALERTGTARAGSALRRSSELLDRSRPQKVGLRWWSVAIDNRGPHRC